MSEPSGPGMDEAVEVSCEQYFANSPLTWEQLSESTRGWLRDRERKHIERAYEVIAAAVRADERAKALAALDAAVAENEQFTSQAAGVRYARACVIRALGAGQ